MASAPRQPVGAVIGRERQDLVQARHRVLGRTKYRTCPPQCRVADRALDWMLHHRPCRLCGAAHSSRWGPARVQLDKALHERDRRGVPTSPDLAPEHREGLGASLGELRVRAPFCHIQNSPIPCLLCWASIRDNGETNVASQQMAPPIGVAPHMTKSSHRRSSAETPGAVVLAHATRHKPCLGKGSESRVGPAGSKDSMGTYIPQV